MTSPFKTRLSIRKHFFFVHLNIAFHNSMDECVPSFHFVSFQGTQIFNICDDNELKCYLQLEKKCTKEIVDSNQPSMFPIKTILNILLEISFLMSSITSCNIAMNTVCSINCNRKIQILHMKKNVNMSFQLQCHRRKFTSYTVIKKAFNRLIG